MVDRKAPVQPSRLNDTHRPAFAAIIESGPIPAIHGVVRWRMTDLCQGVFDDYAISIAKQTLSRELAPWAIASYRPVPAIMRRPTALSRTLTKLSPPA